MQVSEQFAQTDDQIVIRITGTDDFLKVDVEFYEFGLEVTISLDEYRDRQYMFSPLEYEIDPEKSSFKKVENGVECVLHKKDKHVWKKILAHKSTNKSVTSCKKQYDFGAAESAGKMLEATKKNSSDYSFQNDQNSRCVYQMFHTGTRKRLFT